MGLVCKRLGHLTPLFLSGPVWSRPSLWSYISLTFLHWNVDPTSSSQHDSLFPKTLAINYFAPCVGMTLPHWEVESIPPSLWSLGWPMTALSNRICWRWLRASSEPVLERAGSFHFLTLESQLPCKCTVLGLPLFEKPSHLEKDETPHGEKEAQGSTSNYQTCSPSPAHFPAEYSQVSDPGQCHMEPKNLQVELFLNS